MNGCVLNSLYMCLKEVSRHISENLKKKKSSMQRILFVLVLRVAH